MNKGKRTTRRKITTPKDCPFCKEEKTPHFAEVAMLQKFTSERGKIIPRSRSGVCAKHQRRLSTAIKHARHLALMPFIVRD
jgi:small subunit ribosomal protein S18